MKKTFLMYFVLMQLPFVNLIYAVELVPDCININDYKKAKASGIDEVDLSIVKQHFDKSMKNTILYELEKASMTEPNRQAAFKLRWKFDSNGKVTASCDCEDVLNQANSIEQARFTYRFMKRAIDRINKTSETNTFNRNGDIISDVASRSKIIIPKLARNKEFCFSQSPPAPITEDTKKTKSQVVR